MPRLVVLLALLGAVTLDAQTAAKPAPAPAIPTIAYTRFVLKNGLTLLVHEDHKAPIVAVNVWYHMGSKNESPGKTGFAHLYEHLMFGGSEHHPEGYLKALEPIGATELNGTTNEDRTNYFQNVPTPALDRVLWLESDRMGFMVNFVDQKLLDLQRGVVQNEKRQGENEPYGKMWITVAENTYPKGHPYAHSVIGSMDDLNAASLEDVKQWFRDGYGAANATLVVAGDVNTADVKQRVEHFFGEIPPGPPITRPGAWVAKLQGERRMVMQDRVPQTRIVKVWNVPQFGSDEASYLTLASNILTEGKTSRLYKRLVFKDRTATTVAGFLDLREISSQLWIFADVQPGGDAKAVEKAMDEEIAAFVAKGPTPAELAQAKIQIRSGFVRGAERIGGFGGASDLLAHGQVIAGDADEYAADQRRIAAAVPAQVRDVAQRWLTGGVFVLTVEPFPAYEASPVAADRTKLPDAGASPAATLPKVERAQLSNGLQVQLARRTNIPFVRLWLQVDGGYAADPHALPGLSSMMASMMIEGTTTRSSQQIADQTASDGAYLYAEAHLDYSRLMLGVLKDKLDPALDLYADVLLRPTFPESQLARLKKIALAQIDQERVDPYGAALRVLPALIYGEEHPYGEPWTGSGTVASVNAMTSADLANFHRTWFKPNHGTMIVVGDITMAELLPKLERALKGWKPGDVPAVNIAPVMLGGRTKLYVIDRPGAEQSLILVGQLVPSIRSADDYAYRNFNDAFGGAFGARINMNLREDKHWSYGASSFAMEARGQRLWAMYAPVQTNKTKEAIEEVKKELNGVTGDRPITAAELQDAKDRQTRTMAGDFETGSAVARAMSTIDAFGLSEDYYETFPGKIRAVTTDELTQVVNRLIVPGKQVWVVIGDKAKIEADLKAEGLGTVTELDADGKPKSTVVP
jgi:zinc protease